MLVLSTSALLSVNSIEGYEFPTARTLNLIQIVGATLAVVLNGAGASPAPTVIEFIAACLRNISYKRAYSRSNTLKSIVEKFVIHLYLDRV